MASVANKSGFSLVEMEDVSPSNINEALLIAYVKQLKSKKVEKRYTCHVCHKTFSKSYNRSAHMRLHTQEKPFVCDHRGCTKAFTWKSSLKSHRASHSRETESVLNKRRRSHGSGPVRRSDNLPTGCDVESSSSTCGSPRSGASIEPPPARTVNGTQHMDDIAIGVDVSRDLETLKGFDDIDFTTLLQPKALDRIQTPSIPAVLALNGPSTPEPSGWPTESAYLWFGPDLASL
eukprot:CAMPEP_0198323442 /NCGR_PEP_ID=MMETSP1450-20131203/11679_1 /TAXON_ID=753684 ORGANISM="Madagascaria erythrocladiodes, Strain CCMP3234" /NCGR_SAMPLE_ID=MMETSP1450 /ASSEMBLY_ACC=CAM_ASM_001115 /LENGTH=232 /DNA_ID=CAMNT_0044027145 /DNA_START=268 /DNA_END=966 /DNA_ORIENTATION=+